MNLRSADGAEDAGCVTFCTLRICVIWDVKLCRWVSSFFLVDYVTEYEGITVLENILNYLSDNTSYPRRLRSLEHHCENLISHMCAVCFAH
jgi:hypothetical protein